MCQFPDSAGGGAFGTRRRWGRRRSGLVCLSFRCVCSDFASKAARRDVEEQAASAQTTDLVEDASKASERAVGLRFCSLKSHCRLWPLPLLVQGEQLQKTALENEAPAKTANRCVWQMANARESTPAVGRIWPQPDEHETGQKTRLSGQTKR